MFPLIWSILCVYFGFQLTNSIGVRKNIIDLTKNEKDTILNALYAMKQNPSKYDPNYNAFDYFGVMHKLSTDPLKTYGHCQWSFLPWHRAFLYLFEQEIQFYANDTSISLPYWDLSKDLSNKIVLEDTTFLGGNGNESAGWIVNQQNYSLNCNNFPIPDVSVNAINTANASCLIRNIGEGRVAGDNRTYGGELPHIDVWDELLENEDLNYDTYPYNSMFMNYSQYNTSFRAILEGCDPSWKYQKDVFIPRGACMFLHGAIHVYLGGQLASAASPLDPIFFMLHNWIDLMWAKWQDKYGIDYTFPLELGNQSLFEIENQSVALFSGQIWTSLDVLDHREQLNYMYDVQRSVDDEKDNIGLIVGLTVGIVVAIILVVALIYYCRGNKNKGPYQTL